MNVVEYVIKFREQGAGRAINKIDSQIKNLDSSIKRASNSLQGFAAGIGAAFGISEVVNFGRSVLDTTVTFERYAAILDQVTGSAEGAQNALSLIGKVAADTSFDINDTTLAFTRLASTGIKLNEERLKQIADFALANNPNRTLTDFAEAILDSRVNENERLKEFNITTKQINSKIRRFFFRGMEFDVKNTQEAITEFLIELGKMPRVAGINEKVLNTLGGQIAKSKDEVIFLKKDIGNELMPTFLEAAKVFGKFLEKIRDFIKFLKGTRLGVDGFVKSITIAIGSVAALGVGLFALSNPIGIAITGIGLLTAAYFELTGSQNKVDESTRKLLEEIENVNSTMPQLTQGTREAINEFVGINTEIQKTSAILTFFEKVGQGIVSVLKEVVILLQSMVESVGELINSPFESAGKKIRNLLGLSNAEQAKNPFERIDAAVRVGLARMKLAEKEAQVGSGVSGLDATTSGAITSATTGKGSSAASSTVSSAAPRQFNINIENLVREFVINTSSSMQENAQMVKEKMQQALLEAVADVQIAR